jgi:hypothetical protein
MFREIIIEGLVEGRLCGQPPIQDDGSRFEIWRVERLTS